MASSNYYENDRDDDEKCREMSAKECYLHAVELERNRRPYEAIRWYKEAMKKQPDIENEMLRCFASISINAAPSINVAESVNSQEAIFDSYDPVEPFIDRLLRMTDGYECIALPEDTNKVCFANKLPLELWEMIFEKVASNKGDARSLEMIGAVCRKFFILTRKDKLWENICRSIWENCDENQIKMYGDWREMFLCRLHVETRGVYIGDASYVRHGDPVFTGNNIPLHFVQFYRYIRFFGDKTCLVSGDYLPPKKFVACLKTKNSISEMNIFLGTYEMEESIVHVKYRRNARHYTLVFEVRRWMKYKTKLICKQFLLNTGNLMFENLSVENYPHLYYSRVKSYED